MFNSFKNNLLIFRKHINGFLRFFRIRTRLFESEDIGNASTWRGPSSFEEFGTLDSKDSTRRTKIL